MRTTARGMLTAGALALVTTGSRLHAQTWNLFSDFSFTTNPNGAWSYGSAPTLGGIFTAYTTAANPIDGNPGVRGWQTPGTITPVIGINTTGATIDNGNVVLPTGTVLMHGRGFTPLASVVQWKAPTAGTYQLTSSFAGAQINMKANVGVFNNGSSIFSTMIAYDGTSAGFNSLLTLSAGQVLSFAVNRDGADPGGFAGNWTAVAVNITSVSSVVPEPSTYALMVLGLGCLALGLRRRSKVA